jgi:hypothetical protein
MAFQIDHSRKRLLWARARYLASPTRTNLRTYLRIKSARGKYDRRIFDYYRKSDNVIERAKKGARRAYAHGLVITSTTDGRHAPGSLHNPDTFGRGHAVDLGLIESEIGTDRGRRRMVTFQREEFEAWKRGDRPQLQELIGPDNNLTVLRGIHAPLPDGHPLENQHDNHVHLGWRT